MVKITPDSITAIQTWAAQNEKTGSRQGTLVLQRLGNSVKIEYILKSKCSWAKWAWIHVKGFFDGSTHLKQIVSNIKTDPTVFKQILSDTSTCGVINSKISTYNNKTIHKIFQNQITPLIPTQTGPVNPKKVTFAPDAVVVEYDPNSAPGKIGPPKSVKITETNPPVQKAQSTIDAYSLMNKFQEEIGYKFYMPTERDFIIKSFDTVLNELINAIEQKQCKPEKAANDFKVKVIAKVMNESSETISVSVDREDFKYLMGSMVKDFKGGLQLPKIPITPHIKKLIEDYDSGKWKDGEEKIISYHNIEPENREKIKPSLDTILSDKSFQDGLLQYFQSIPKK